MPNHVFTGTPQLNAVTTAVNSSTVDTSQSSYAEVDGFITVVGTATTAAFVTPQWSLDAGVTWHSASPIYAGLTAGEWAFSVMLPLGPILWRLAFTPQVGGTSSTATAWVVVI